MSFSDAAPIGSTYPVPSCIECPVKSLSLYAPLDRDEMGEIQKMRREIKKIPARQIIFSADETYGNIFTVFDGWAYRYMLLADGRRQIFTYFLPGDVIALEAIKARRLHFSVRALTNVTLCSFDKDAFRKMLEAKPVMMDRFDQLCTQRAIAIDNRLMDIGKRTARERLVRLLMFLYGTLLHKKLVQNNEFFFPLRHEHIADTIGLTPVHVSRSMSSLRREKLIDTRGRKLIILDEEELLLQAGLGKDYIVKKLQPKFPSCAP